MSSEKPVTASATTIAVSEPVSIPAVVIQAPEVKEEEPQVSSKSVPPAVVVDKKQSRAERFGIITNPVAIAAASVTEAEDNDAKLKKRIEKFGIIKPVVPAKVAPSAALNEELEAKLKKRAEKFGIISPLLQQEVEAQAKKELEAKKLERAKRFNIPTAAIEEEKYILLPYFYFNNYHDYNRKRKREERFKPVVLDPELAAKLEQRKKRFAVAESTA